MPKVHTNTTEVKYYDCQCYKTPEPFKTTSNRKHQKLQKYYHQTRTETMDSYVSKKKDKGWKQPHHMTSQIIKTEFWTKLSVVTEEEDLLHVVIRHSAMK